MKKLNKFLFWSICLGSIIVGSILLSVGISLGGATSFSWGSNGLNFYHNMFTIDDSSSLYSDVIDEKVLAIDLDLEFTEVVVESGDTLALTYSPDISYKVKNNQLEITSSTSKSNRFGIFFGTVKQSSVTITVPDYITRLDVESSGNIRLSNLTLDKIELDIALGNALVENTTGNFFEVDANLGDVTLNDCSFNKLDAELDMGRLTTTNLEILTSAEFKNDMGSMNIDLAGDENDYNFINSTDMGSFSINGNSTPSFYGLIDIFIETTMGSVEITSK